MQQKSSIQGMPGLLDLRQCRRDRWWSLLACLALLLCAMPGNGDAGAQSRLARIALALGKEALPVRIEFARAAIEEMARVHSEEAALARREVRTGERRRELLRWAAAVDDYAGELAAITHLLTPEAVVDVSIGADGSIYLNIAGRPVMVGIPRTSEQADFEQRIIDHFCGLYRCEEFVADIEPPAAASRRQARQPSWSFSQNAGPSCSTEDGLELQFRSLQELSRKREICARLVAELDLLIAALDRQIATGVRIDWNRMTIRGDPGAGRQQLVLDGQGNSLALDVPSLAAVPDFLRRALPWIAARTRGASYHLVLLNADALLAPLLHP